MNPGIRVAIIGMLVSGLLAVTKITVGLFAGSTSVVADGVESAADVFASGVVLLGLWIAAKPADENHPYGHGRFEILTGLGIGLGLLTTGALIGYHSLQKVGEFHPPPKAYAIWPLLLSIALKAGLSTFKFRYGKKIRSSALMADAWNDTVDILSGVMALIALGLTLYDPIRYLAADHYGGLAVGLIVVILGLQVIRETSLQLMDTMPGDDKMGEIRRVALAVPGALGVEKCYARKTGMQYHVDLHLEVDPQMSVQDSHDLATRVRIHVKDRLEWVADVLVHVEPHTNSETNGSDPVSR